MEKDPARDTAAELLADWRAAGRDSVAAKAAAKVATLALQAARSAEAAAAETEAAAASATEAVQRALQAAASAKQAAASASEAAQMILSIAEADKVHANHDVEEAVKLEGEAADRFHEGQRHGFTKDEAPEAGNTAR